MLIRMPTSQPPGLLRQASVAKRHTPFRSGRIAAACVVAVVVLSSAGCGNSESYGERTKARAAQAQADSWREKAERSHRGKEQASPAARNAESVERTKGVGRPCSEADGFDYYFLDPSFEEFKLTGKNRQCDPPPRTIRDAGGKLVHENPGRVNTVFYVYGDCDVPRGPNDAEGGCTAPLSVSSSPACEQPHSLYTRYSGGDHPLPHRHIRIRGARAAIFDQGPPLEPTRIEIYTGDARVLIAGVDPGVVNRAAAKIVAAPHSPGGARSADVDLPEAIAGAAEDDATRNPPC